MKRNANTFEEFLLESFGDGISCRELRLSAEELAYVKVKYPRAMIKSLLSDISEDGKSWYEVALSPANSEKTDSSGYIGRYPTGKQGIEAGARGSKENSGEIRKKRMH